MHYVFDTPKDKLVWDVSHQCYPHKGITGEDRIALRKGRGFSGFTKRAERIRSFSAAHSSTSISSTLGIAVADINNENKVCSYRRWCNEKREWRMRQ